MVPVDDAETRWQILKYLLTLIEAGHIEPLLTGGLTPEALEVLRNRRVRDVTKIAADPSIGFGISLDCHRLAAAFLRLDAVRRDKELIEYFIRHGAPMQLLGRIFRISAQELRTMREVLCADVSERGGRPSLPEPVVREAINATWAASAISIGGEPPISERERLYNLHRQYPAYSIGALWTVVNEFAAPGQSHA